MPVQAAVVPWSGGYVAIGAETTNGPDRGWVSADGRSWTELPASVFGFDATSGDTLFNSATACGDRVLVEMDHATPDGVGTVTLWSSSDGTTWTQASFHNDSRGTLVAVGSVAVADTETGGGARQRHRAAGHHGLRHLAAHLAAGARRRPDHRSGRQ